MQHQTQTTTTTAVPEDFQPGTLVQLTTTAARRSRSPFRTAIVLGALKAGDDYMGLVWFWTEGEARFTHTIRTVLPAEVTLARTTLTDMPEGAYWTLREQYEAAQDAATATEAADYQRQAARYLSPLKAPFAAADQARYGRVHTDNVLSQPRGVCGADAGTGCAPACTREAVVREEAADLSGYLSEPCAHCPALSGQECTPICPNRLEPVRIH